MTDSAFSPRAIFGSFFSFFVIAAISYFAYAALQGSTGLVEQVRLAHEETRLALRLEAVQAERRDMENLTRRLSEDGLDLDLLDERVRAVLGYARADEIVIR